VATGNRWGRADFSIAGHCEGNDAIKAADSKRVMVCSA